VMSAENVIPCRPVIDLRSSLPSPDLARRYLQSGAEVHAIPVSQP
jgi:hypothetical protein